MKKLVIFALCLATALSLCAPALAVNEDDTRCLKYTDTTDADSGTLWGAERMRDYDGETEVTS